MQKSMINAREVFKKHLQAWHFPSFFPATLALAFSPSLPETVPSFEKILPSSPPLLSAQAFSQFLLSFSPV